MSRQPVVRAALGASTLAGHLAFLGWHHLQEYETWTVWCYAVFLAVLVAVPVWLRTAPDAAMVVAISATLVWSVDAASGSKGDGSGDLWPAGAMFVLFGAAAGGAVVAGVTGALRALYDRRAA